MNEDEKNKHLTLEDRIDIERMLAQKMTFKEIGKFFASSPVPQHRKQKSKHLFQKNFFGQ